MRLPGSASGVKPRARLRRLRQIVQRPVRAAHQRRRQRGRDLRDRDADAVGPRRQRVVEDPRRLLRPVVARRSLEVRCARMIVDVADEQHRDCALVLRRQRLAPCRRRLGRDDAVERAVRIALARLVIEREHDLPLHVAVVVVVTEVRRADAEADEHDRSGRRAARAESMRIELLTRPKLARDSIAGSDLQRCSPPGSPMRRGHQVVRLEERTVRARRLSAPGARSASG